MVQFLSIIFFLGFLQFLLGFSKVPVFLCHPVLSHSSIFFSRLHTVSFYFRKCKFFFFKSVTILERLSSAIERVSAGCSNK